MEHEPEVDRGGFLYFDITSEGGRWVVSCGRCRWREVSDLSFTDTVERLNGHAADRHNHGDHWLIHMNRSQ